MNLILFGFKGVGKTHLGKLLAKQLERPFLDTDDLMIRKYNCPVRELYRRLGEESFRDIERNILLEIASCKFHVIALGGGTLLPPENQKIAKEMGHLIYLKASFATVQRRILKEGLPAFVEEGESLKKMYSQRTFLYESIPAICVDVDCLDEISLTPWPQTILDKFLESPRSENPMALPSGL